MAFDKNKPADNGVVSEGPQEIRDNLELLSTMFDSHEGSSLFEGTIRFDATACKFLRYNGSNWVDKLISVAGGGTGIGSYTTGDILYASATDTLSKLAGVATGYSLLSGGVGTAPSWGKIGLTTHVSGTLPIANGGTNKTSFTAGYIHYGSFDTSSALSFNSGTGTLSATAFSGNGSALTNINASNITTGTISIDRLPHGALERMVNVADQAARYALTTATVQNGDTVLQQDTGVMYFIIDDTNLNNAAGYQIYSAGTATAVEWSGVLSKPTTISGYGITDAVTTSGNQTIDGTKEFSSTITGSISGTAATATALATTITLWGQDFNGSANVSGLLSGPGSIELTGVYGGVGESDIALSGAGARMIWNPKKAAFRAGYVDSTQWDVANVGNSSTAMGNITTASGNASTAMGNITTASGIASTAMGASTTASGFISTAMGYQTTASGYASTAMGASTTASGSGSTAMGFHTKAEAYGCVVIGRYNVGGGTPDSWVTTDPLFEIGNGTGNSTRANALTVLKNGNTGLGISNPSYQLQLSTDSAAKPTTTTWTTTSDARVKDNIVPANLERCYEIVKALPLVHHGWKERFFKDEVTIDKSQLGWIAQDVQAVFPKAVRTVPITYDVGIEDGEEEYFEQEYKETVISEEISQIDIVDGVPVQKITQQETIKQEPVFEIKGIVDENGNPVMEEITDKTGKIKRQQKTHKVPKMIKKVRPKIVHQKIEDGLNLDSDQILKALYGAVQFIIKKVEVLEGRQE